MNINTNQITIIHTLLTKAGLMAQKKSLVAGVSNGRTESTKELTMDEAIALINYLKQQNTDDLKADQMRKKILSMAHRLRWEKEDGSVDVDAVNTWCMNKSYAKKPLNEYTYKELPKLVTQFQQVYSSLIKQL